MCVQCVLRWSIELEVFPTYKPIDKTLYDIPHSGAHLGGSGQPRSKQPINTCKQPIHVRASLGRHGRGHRGQRGGVREKLGGHG